MDTPKITTLAELWEQRDSFKSSIDDTRDFLQEESMKGITAFEDANNDAYKNSVFKNLWNKKITWKDVEVVQSETPLQKDLFYGSEYDSDYLPDQTVVFSNGTYNSDNMGYARSFYWWKHGYKGGQTYQAYKSLFDYVKTSMPGLLASKLSSSAQVLNIDPHGNNFRLLLTSDAFYSNQTTLDNYKTNDIDGILDSGIYIVRICKGKSAYIKEVHHDERKMFCNQWIYILDYDSKLTLDRNVFNTCGLIDNIHIIQYPGSTLKINTFDRGQQWRNINVTAYQDTKTLLNGSTLLKNSDSGNFVDVHHKGPNGDSDIKYKSAIYDKNTGNFIGQINVDKKAVGTKSFMTNKNLLVDPLAKAISRPILRINTKEIECSHGCTTSKIRDEDIYYLETLGLDKRSAKSMIASGHIQI